MDLTSNIENIYHLLSDICIVINVINRYCYSRYMRICKVNGIKEGT